MSDKKNKILLVEDEQMMVDMYKMRFESEGYEVLVTERGSEVIQIAKKEKPDIILLDVILPETDGFSILQTIKADSTIKDIPVLLLTNLGQESDKTKGEEMGAADYFVKSQHTPVQVIQKVKELIK